MARSANLLTDVTPVLAQAFPNGKPELSASDFDRALKFVRGRANGSVPRPGPNSMDYAWWAHTVVVAWKLRVAEWELNGKVTPEPKFLLCPECEVLLLLDMSSGDVLQCVGGCHRAIRVDTFVQLFRRPAQTPPRSYNLASGQVTQPGQSGPGPARLDTTVPKGQRPEDYGITEGVQKSKKALVGWRMWDVRPDSPGILRSLHQGAKVDGWPSMQPLQGLCAGKTKDEITDHVCPSWEHRCGVHAVKETFQLRKWGSPSTQKSTTLRVVGQIEMWGRVLEYQEGFRAEWAYPLKLYLPEALPSPFDGIDVADALWMRYLVEVVTDDQIYDSI